MAIVQNIISTNKSPLHAGYGYVGQAGNKGLTAPEKTMGSGVFPVDANGAPLSRPTVDMTVASGNVIIGPAYPGTGTDRQVGPLGSTVATLNNLYNNRFDDTNYYHGSGSYGGPS